MNNNDQLRDDALRAAFAAGVFPVGTTLGYDASGRLTTFSTPDVDPQPL
jgi:hypothetical protein